MKINNDIQHHPEDRKFILPIDENNKAYIMYNTYMGTLNLIHSEVPFALRGKGIGKQLVEKTFQYMKDHDLKGRAICSYIRLIRDRNSQWHEIID